MGAFRGAERAPSRRDRRLVAGTRSAALEKMRMRRWTWQLPFGALGRVLDAIWEEAKLGLGPVACVEAA